MSRRRQRGMTTIGGLLTLLAVGFVALMAIRIVPIYIAYFGAWTALEGIKKEPRAMQMSLYEIHTALQKRFDIGYVTVVQANQVKLQSQGRDRVLTLAYQDKRHLIANLDIVASFDINVVLSP